MKIRAAHDGFTIVEMLVVLAIIVILISLTLTGASYFRSQENAKLVRETMDIIGAALQEYGEYDVGYPHDDFRLFSYPVDCNEFNESKIEGELTDALNLNSCDIVSGGSWDDANSGISVMYFLLGRVPQCRETLGKIDRRFVKATDAVIKIKVDSAGQEKEYPLYTIVDPWGTAYRYDYYDETLSSSNYYDSRKNVPVITSAGADKVFDTDDDISSQ